MQMLIKNVLVVCALVAAGTTLAKSAKTEDRIKVVTEGGIGTAWTAAPGASFAAPGYPASMKSRAANVCLNIGYTLGDEGKPENLSLLSSWSRDSADIALSDEELEVFVQSAAMALSQWRFAPKEGMHKAQTTYTSATMTFNGAEATRPKSLPAECRIADLPAYVLEQSKGAEGRVNKALLDRMEIQGRAAREAAVNSRYSGEREDLQ